jgi:release factor glutamine methyltransferase
MRLRAAGIPGADLEARLLLERATGLSRERQLMEPERLLAAPEQAGLDLLVARRLRREPLAYLVGEREFFGLSFAVSPAVLVPRPETELLIEEALRAFPDRKAPLRLLELGIGSGCILVTALTLWPAARGIGVELSRAALEVAVRNARRHAVLDRLGLIRGHWATALRGRFDLVLGNPPYVDRDALDRLEPEVATFEPRLALAGGPDGLDAYRLILPELPELLAEDGLALLELGAGQADAVAGLAASAGLEVSFAQDLAGVARCARFRARRPGAAPPDGA